MGDHIRKRRIDLGLGQKDVARIVNATTSSVTNWEKNRTSPRLYLLPKAFAFLRYQPLEGKPASLGGKIKEYRVRNGLSLRKLAKKLGVDPGTLARWEGGQSNPKSRITLRLDELLNQEQPSEGRKRRISDI